MNNKIYLILEQHKFSHGVKDVWTVKFCDLTRDKAFEKLVALRTLNENPNIFHYLVDMSYLWKKDEPLVLTKDMEVKEDQEQMDMPF